MNIKVITDSTCDLSPELLAKYDIGIVPLIVMKGGQEYLDGQTIVPRDIFAHVAEGGELCSTAARNMGIFEDVFAKYAKDYDGIVHVSLGSSFSSSYQNACLAAEEFDNVLVIDSAALHAAQGIVAIKACQLAASVSSLEEMKEKLEAFKDTIDSSFVVDKLDYLAKGGRCSSATALGANLLSLKPCIELKDNHMGVGKKYRGSLKKCLVTFVRDRLEGREDIDNSVLFLTYTQDFPEDVLEAVREAVGQCGSFETIHECVAGCTISCHCGPNTMGLMFVRK